MPRNDATCKFILAVCTEGTGLLAKKRCSVRCPMMKADAVNAWFLRSYPSGDTSLRISFFTSEYGIVEALYKGGRTPKKKSNLQPFMPLWLALDIRHEWYYVRHLESDSPALCLSGQALFAGLYVNEMLYSMLKPHDAAPVLYETYVNTLEGMTQALDRLSIESLLRRFERVLLDVAGYAVSFTHDAQTGEEINTSASYRFVAGAGFYLSKDGFSGQHIVAFSTGKLEDAETLRTVKGFMRQAMAHALDGKEIQTRKLYLNKGI